MNSKTDSNEKRGCSHRETTYLVGDCETLLIEKLSNFIASFYENLQLKNLGVVGKGLDFLVCRADSVKLGTVAIKTPWKRKISNDNDSDLDARDLLKQEAKISMYSGKFGLPLPLIHCICIDDNEIDFLISQFIDSDNSPPDGYLFGQLMKEIHNKPAPQLKPVLQGDIPLNRTLSERIARRLRVVANLAAIDIEIPTLEAVQSLLDRYEVKRYSLLHMDARPANLLTQKGSIVGFVDWANALTADRGLELARIAEYGYLTPEFLRGYGQENCFSHLPKEVELIYRLDTAVMLGVVFLSEAPDPENAKIQLTRILELCDELKKYFIYHFIGSGKNVGIGNPKKQWRWNHVETGGPGS